MFCYIVNYLLTWILKLTRSVLFTSQTDPKFCLDGLNLILYQTVFCQRNCAVIIWIKWIGGWKSQKLLLQFKRFDPHVFHQDAIAIYYVATPFQHSQMRCEGGTLGYLANSWRAATKQITVMSRPKPDGGNKFWKFLRPDFPSHRFWGKPWK